MSEILITHLRIAMLTMYQQITIKTLHQQGKKKVHIAKEMSCHRNTVKNILDKNKVVEKQVRSKSSDFDQHRDLINDWLKKKVSRIRMHEILVEEYGLKRNYDSLCKYIQKNLSQKAEAYGVQAVPPGEEAEVDFGYVGMQPGNGDRLQKTWILVVTPSYSRNSHYQTCADQKIGTLIQGLINAFTYFNGVPKRLKVDNMRTAILKNQHYDLQFNQDLLEFASHYKTVIIPCTPYHPHQKGKVESDVGFVKGNFFCERKFRDQDDMQAQLRDWMINYANKRVHGTTKKIPSKVWELEERQALQPLPEHDFVFFDRGERIVKKNCHINFKDNYYSAPSNLVGKAVTIRYTNKLLRLVYQGDQVALHVIQSGRGEYITQRSHLPKHKYYSHTEYQQRWELKMTNMGKYAGEYFRFLIKRKSSYWFRDTRIIYGLAKEHGDQVINLALKRALAYQATSVTTIKNIIEKKLYLLDYEPQLPKTPSKDSITDSITDDAIQVKDYEEIENNQNPAFSLQELGCRNLDYYQEALIKKITPINSGTTL